ncbi:MAG TPA: hypothetical protein VFD85_12745 [Gemmatimonadales bacterium]|nr:hypothetical protein [Gemmatimonadales bacterium]
MVEPGNSFSNTGKMTGASYQDVLAIVLFDQIGNDQITWMARNKCHTTCQGVFVRGVVEIVGARPVLDVIDVSFESRARGVTASRVQLDSTAAPAAPAMSAEVASSGWTLLQAADWRARAPGLIGKRVEVAGNLSTQPVVDPRSSSSNRGWMRGPVRGEIFAIVLFDQISNEQVAWMARNNCPLTCAGVFVRGVVEIVGAGPVLQMTDVSSESRPGFTAAVAAPAADAQGTPPAPLTGAPAAADSGWTLVTAADWRARAPGLIGKRVELAGDLSTQALVDPSDPFSSTGTMRGASWKDPLATVLFDHLTAKQAGWFYANKCLETCVGVFVRGVVVRGQRGSGWRGPGCHSRRPPPSCTAETETPPVLQMTDISFDSRAGGVAVSMVRLDTARGETPAVEKPLLPPGGVPTTLGPSAVTEIPTATPESDTGTMLQRMQAHNLIMRQRDLNMEKGMIQGPERPADFETSYRSIRDTPLSKVFANYPWNIGRNQWPRVALVVEEAPSGDMGAFEYARGGEKIKDRCWRLRARLWTGPASSQDIAPFNWCLSEMRFNVSYNAVVQWGMSPASNMSEHNTGPDRTLGPNPPFVLVPRFHYRDGLHGDTIMLGNILLDMSFGLGMPDGRVWIVQ